MSENRANRKEYITILSVLSSFAVVALHVNGFWSLRQTSGWVVNNFIECLFYFAVPVFFMITGATLIDYRKRYTTKQFFAKRIKRTVIPFLIWSIIGAVFFYANHHEWLGMRNFVSGILNPTFVNIYWFFPALFAVYLIIPFFALIPEENRKQAFSYAIILCLLVNNILPLACKLLNLNYSNCFIFPICGYSLYALLGYCIDRYNLSLKERKLVYVVGVIGFLVHFVGTWWLSWKTGVIDMTFKDYLNIPCIVYSVAIFTFFRNIRDRFAIKQMGRLAKPFAPYTYGIYLVQWFILQATYMIPQINHLSLVYILIGTPIVYLVCAGVTAFCTKVPVLRKIV